MPSRNDRRNDTAACPACGQPFTPAGRRRWRSDACRQAAWRRRQPRIPAELPPPRPRKNTTIYECPDRGQRQLGQQRCDECGTFTRRIGPGGPCPHRDEPVAITDIQDPAQ
jgi:hypothetical protein